MCPTGGLLHPLLSQRIYPSNQGLKLSAKAGLLPKGAFICLKSGRLANDRGADMRQKKGRVLSEQGLGGRGTHWPTTGPAPDQHPLTSLPPPVFYLQPSACLFSKQHWLSSPFQLTGPSKCQDPCLSKPAH